MEFCSAKSDLIQLIMANDLCLMPAQAYPQTSNISNTLVGDKIVDHSDVVGEPYIRGLIIFKLPQFYPKPLICNS